MPFSNKYWLFRSSKIAKSFKSKEVSIKHSFWGESNGVLTKQVKEISSVRISLSGLER